MFAPESAVEFPSDREIRSTRLLKAPRELVFEAWTRIEHLSKWWGPRGFSMTVKTFEPRPGGRWHFMFHGPDGTDYWNELSFIEIDSPSRIVLRHENAPQFTATVTFAAKGDDTEVVFASRFDSVEEWEGVKPFAVPGNRQTLDRMEERVAALRAGTAFTIERVFDAPRELVWTVWTDEGHLLKWFGPKGVPMTQAAMDFTPGGSFHYCLRAADGSDMWGLWHFREIVAPERIVLLQSFSDASRGLTRHPMAPVWPLQTLSTTTFREEGGKTRIALEWMPFNATDEEIATFQKSFASMNGGWNGTMDLLDAYLASLPAVSSS